MTGQIKLVLDGCKSIAARKYDKVCRFVKRSHWLMQASVQRAVEYRLVLACQRRLKEARKNRVATRAVEM